LSNHDAAPKTKDNMPRAMSWMILSGISFALMGATVKLSGDVPLMTKVFFRNLVTMIITASVAWRTQRNPFGRTNNLGRLVARSLAGVMGVGFYFLALNELNLAEASLLNKTSPFFVTIFAVVFLKEKFNRAMIPALLVAFAGTLLVVKPRFDVTILPALAGVASGLFAAMAYTFVRSLKGLESPNRIIFTFSFISTLATLPFLFIFPMMPSTGQWFSLIGTGLCAAGGQYGLTYAYHHARASRISVFTYLHVLFSLIVGFLIWNERPDILSIGGGLLIIVGAIISHRATTRE
jgi:drug/metabolite transporter (DMT)-like permease